jgi:hypothetical protein
MSLRFILTVATLIVPGIVFGSPQAQSPLGPPLVTVEKHGPRLNKSSANAPHIFNAIHSSMRQWGSSLYHNGMSFFPARIPPNTHLYHGTNKAYAITGMQWLAFEIEHAELFAQSCVGRPPPPPPEGSLGHPGNTSPHSMEIDWVETLDGMQSVNDHYGQVTSEGFLHTYRTTRSLTNLL